MSQNIRHFLVIFDHSADVLIDVKHFGRDSDAALAAYAATEREYQDRRNVEIVLIGSDSFETVQKTHANYFGALPGASEFLVGL